MRIFGFEITRTRVIRTDAAWLNALAYSQFDEAELVDGTLWRLLQ